MSRDAVYATHSGRPNSINVAANELDSCPDRELVLLWIVAPLGLDSFFAKPATEPANRGRS